MNDTVSNAWLRPAQQKLYGVPGGTALCALVGGARRWATPSAPHAAGRAVLEAGLPCGAVAVGRARALAGRTSGRLQLAWLLGGSEEQMPPS